MARGRLAKRRDDLLDHPRLKSSGTNEFKDFKDNLYQSQGCVCGLCKQPIETNKDLDHDHTTGLCRAVLCHKCNWLLGKIENNLNRLKLPFECVIDYLLASYSDMPLHPNHRTAEEKRLSRNERARLKRGLK